MEIIEPKDGVRVEQPDHSEQAAYATPGACPVCRNDLAVVRLECGTCGTAVVGRFKTSRFARLSGDQLAFLEAFLRSRGNIRKVERELGISYPTVRGRLNALLAALGIAAAPDEEDEAVQRRRREILDQVESGALRPDDATRLLRQINR
jgi:hypothetical protein